MTLQKKQKENSLIDTIKNNQIVISSEVMEQLKVPKNNLHIFVAHIVLPKLEDYSTLEEDVKIIDLLAKWKIYSGIAQNASEIDFNLLLDFIKVNFGRLNFFDIDAAINLSTSNQLEYKKTDESFATFSPAFIGRILSAYQNQYKPKIISEIRDKIKRIEIEQKNNEPCSDEDNLTSFKKIVKDIWINIKSNEEFIDYKNWFFNYLYKNGIVIIDEITIRESRKWAIQKIRSVNLKSDNSITNAFNSLSKLDNKNRKSPIAEKEIFQLQCVYVIIEFCKAIENIDDFLETITIEKIKISET